MHTSNEQIIMERNSKNLFSYVDNKISAGFPSPALDYIEQRLDLNEHLNQHPNSTFIIRVKGNSMIDEGIHDDDLLIVDKSLTPVTGSIVIAELNGEFTVKRLEMKKGKLYLIAANKDFKAIPVDDDNEFIIWGVVTFTIHKVY